MGTRRFIIWDWEKVLYVGSNDLGDGTLISGEANAQNTTISNQLVKSFCDRRKNLYYIDIVFAFTDAKGTPDKTLFLEDQLHPSKKGYAIWERLVADQVKKTARRSLRKALNSRKQTEKSEKNE